MRRILKLHKTDNIHLSLISTNYFNEYFTLYIEEEDYHSPFYYLRSDLIDSAETDKGAFLIGKYFIRYINGVCTILNIQKIQDYESFLDISQMYELYENNTSRNITPRLPRNYSIINPVINYDSFDISKYKSAGEDLTRKILYLIYIREDVRNLILIAGTELNWIVLYSLFETAKFYGKGNFLKRLGDFGIGKKSIAKFTQTANNFGYLSFNSRHGVNSSPMNFKPMEFEEAKELILQIVNIYLRDIVSDIDSEVYPETIKS